MNKRIVRTVLPILLIVGLTAAALFHLVYRADPRGAAPAPAEETHHAENKAETEEIMEEHTAIPAAEAENNSAPDRVIKLYVDQGHNPTGTWNTGAVWNGIFEHDKNYEVGVLLYNLLKDDPRFEIRLSRPTAGTVLGYDNTTALLARSAEANAWGADYFISIHCNAATDMASAGVESFAYSDSDEGFAMGLKLVEAICDTTGLYDRGTFARPGLSVLNKTEMPAVLVELGFLSNPKEAALLAERPELFAEALHKGILAYFGF